MVGLNVIVFIDKRDVSDSASVVCNEFAVTRWALIPGVGCEHALETHADAFNSLDWGPAGRAEKIKADNSITIDVWMHWDRAGGTGGNGEVHELHFGGLCDCIVLVGGLKG